MRVFSTLVLSFFILSMGVFSSPDVSRAEEGVDDLLKEIESIIGSKGAPSASATKKPKSKARVKTKTYASPLKRLEAETAELKAKQKQLDKLISQIEAEQIEISKKKKVLAKEKARREAIMANPIERDIQKYRDIANPESYKKMKEKAWNRLLAKYPKASGTKEGNIVLFKAKLGVIGQKKVSVKGGCFEMGNFTKGEGFKNAPAHNVCVDNFKLDRHEVTQKIYSQVMGKNPSAFSGCDECPVENVTWNNANEFCENLNMRLPTEAEWEYAARSGGKKVEYATKSGSVNMKEANYGTSYGSGSSRDGYQNTSPVMTYPPNGLGLFDLSGNVMEWVHDYYDEKYYYKSPKKNPNGPKDGKNRVLRGGSWRSGEKKLRAFGRYSGESSRGKSSVGFRCAK